MKFGKLFSLIAATALALALLATPAFAEADDEVARGDWGEECTWRVVEGDVYTGDGFSYKGATLILEPKNSQGMGTGGQIAEQNQQPWAAYKGDGAGSADSENVLITEVKVEDGVKFPENSQYLFQGLRYLRSLDMSKADTSDVTNMDYMFSETTCPHCLGGFLGGSPIDDLRVKNPEIRGLNLEGLNTENVTSMKGMFRNTAAVRELTLPDTFQTGKVTNFGQMFVECYFLEEISGIDRFDTSSARNVDEMFRRCYSLASLDISGFNLDKVETQSYMLDTDDGLNGFKEKDEGKDEGTKMEGLGTLTLGPGFKVLDTADNVFPSGKTWVKDDADEGAIDLNDKDAVAKHGGFEGVWLAVASDSKAPSGPGDDEPSSSSSAGGSSSASSSSSPSSSASASASGSTGGASASSGASRSSGAAGSSAASSSATASTAASGSKGSSGTSGSSDAGVANHPAPSAAVSSSSGSGSITGSSTAHSAVSLAKAKLTLAAASYTYNGKAKKPGVTVKLGSTVLKKGADYTVSYAANKNVGTAKVTVKGAGAYRGSISATFKIKPKGTSVSKLAKAKKAFTVKWKKQAKQVSGYQLRYSTSKSFKSGVHTVTVGKSSATSKKVSKLKAKKTYYVQVRTYKKAGGKTYYSVWSKAKKVCTA